MPVRFDRQNRPLVMLLAMGLALALCAPAKAQIVATQPDSGLYGSENTAGVYVRDSAVALEKMAHAKRMQDLKEWGTSADLYQEILQKYPDRVVPAGVDANNRIIQYTSVTEAVREAICQWPPEGLDVYRARYETVAANLLNSAGDTDLSKLHQVCSLYFVTEAAKRASIRLMDDYFELGDYPAVAQIGSRLLQWHPNLIAQRPLVLYRVAIAEKLCNEAETAQGLLKELHDRFPKATGVVRGEQVVLADSLQQELSSASRIVRTATNDSWMTMGGDSSRGKISSATGRPGAKLYSVMLGKRNTTDPNVRQEQASQHKSGVCLGVMPVVDKDELFFQDNLHVYGISLDSGLTLPGWATTYPNSNGQYTLSGNVSPMPAGQQLCVTLSDKYIVAVMGLPDEMEATGNGQIGGDSNSRLVCLDRETGAELWTASVRNLPDEQAALRDLQIDGSPLIVGNNAYITGHGSKGQQFDDCYVLCFDLTNGHFRWASYLASAADNQVVQDDMGQVFITNPISHLAYASGRLYAITNLGAVASLDAYNGTIVWLDIYRESDDQNQNPNNNPRIMGMGMGFRRGMGMNGMMSAPRQAPPWTYSPPIVEDGKVFILPADLPKDSKRLLVYDAGTGKEIKRINLNDYQPSNTSEVNLEIPDTLLAVIGDNLILSSAKGAWKIPWKSYRHPKQPRPDGFWQSGLDFDNDEGVRGRAFITTNAVYLPTTQGLSNITLKGGLADQGFFPNGWDPAEEGPGNVLVTQNQVIIAGDQRVDVYTDLEKAVARLNQGVAAAPTDPEARLLYAEIMMVSGQKELAEKKLDEAMQLMGFPRAIPGSPVCTRAFNDAMTFTAKLVSHNGTRQEILRMFDRASATAQSPAQRVAYLAARAKFHFQDNDAADAEDCYQQILVDPQMRPVPLRDPENNYVSQACDVAEKMLTQILSTNAGKAAYGKYETMATAQFAAAAGDPQKLLLVAQNYPNSQVARQAIIAAADYFEAANDPRMASQVLRRMFNKYHDQDNTPILEAMARNYLKIPGRLDAAVARIAMAAAIKPDAMLKKPLLLPDGSAIQDITFRQAHDALRQYSAKLSMESLPEISLPTYPEVTEYKKIDKRYPSAFLPEIKISNIDALLVPLEGFERYDKIVTWTAGTGVAIYSVGASTASSAAPSITEKPRSIAWLAGNLMAWGDRSVSLLNGQTGKPVWNVELDSLGAVEMAMDDSVKEAPRNAPGGATDVIARPFPNNPRFIVRNGVVVARVAGIPIVPEVPAAGGMERIDQVKPVGDRIIVTTTTGRVFGIDSNNGQIAWQTRLSNHAVDHLVANDDFTVFRIADETKVQLMVLNSFSGELIGHKIFPLENDNSFPLNLALSDDGILVYTLPEQICVQDLHDANLGDRNMQPKAMSVPSNANPPLFMGCDKPEELLINQGRIFAVINQGRQVRVYDLDTAEPVRFHDETNGDTDMLLSTGSAGASPIVLKISDEYLFIRHSGGMTASRIDRPSHSFQSHVYDNVAVFQWFFGKDFIVFLQRVNSLGAASAVDVNVTLRAFNRIPSKNPLKQEGGNQFSGDELFNLPIINPSGILAWQVVKGGVVYFSGDGVLHMLPGAHGHLQ